MLNRNEDWVQALYEFVRSRKDTPYAWGTNDCCSFPCDAILAMTGTDVFEEFRGMYSDEAGANIAIDGAVGTVDKIKVIEYVTAKFEMPEIAPAFAQRGDVVLLSVDGGFALGVVHLDGVNAAAVAEEGLHRIPMANATRAWKV